VTRCLYHRVTLNCNQRLIGAIQNFFNASKKEFKISLVIKSVEIQVSISQNQLLLQNIKEELERAPFQDLAKDDGWLLRLKNG